MQYQTSVGGPACPYAYGVEGRVLVFAEKVATLHGAGEGIVAVKVDARGELALNCVGRG